MTEELKKNHSFGETLPTKENQPNAINQVENLSKCVESTKLVVISLFEDVLKKVKEIFTNIKKVCNKTYEFLFDKLKTQEESIEV